jgi:hypothetical protein
MVPASWPLSLQCLCLSEPIRGNVAHVMPKWLKGMVAPTLMLWLCAIA